MDGSCMITRMQNNAGHKLKQDSKEENICQTQNPESTSDASGVLHFISLFGYN